MCCCICACCAVLPPRRQDMMGDMLPELLSSLVAVFIAVVLPAGGCQAASKSDDGGLMEGSAGIPNGGLRSVLKDAISAPAIGATVIILITVMVSASAYVCFLKYVCAGCCKPLQVAPALDVEPNKVEEQV